MSNMLIEVDELLSLDERSVRIVDLGKPSIYAQIHLPNAVSLSLKKLVRQVGDATGVLPSQEALYALVQELQLSPQHEVIAYDDEGGAWASRLAWTLHCMGFHQVRVMNGGIHACLRAGVPLTSDVPMIEPVDTLFTPDFSHITQYRIEYDELLSHVQQGAIQLWDCRSLEEFRGERRTARRVGHMPNARHLEWTELFQKDHDFKLLPLDHLRQKLTAMGFDLHQPVVVYCQSHHRSSLAYFVGRLLQWEIRAYDGAWSEWGNQSDSLIVTSGDEDEY